MKLPFVQHAPVMLVAIGLIVISTAVLSYLSYHYTVGRENLVETTLVQNNTRTLKHYVDLIEEKIVENDRALSEMIDVNDPLRWPGEIEAIKKADLNVDQVYFLHPDSN